METTPYFWDCECPQDYVHAKTVAACKRRGARAEDQPDSRVNEVVRMLLGKPGIEAQDFNPAAALGA